MNRLVLAALALLALALVLVAVLQFNRLRRLDQLCRGAFADIDTLLSKRADLIPNLVRTVSGARDFEAATLERVTRARAAGLHAVNVESKLQADGDLTAALGRLFALAEAYPQLTATENFRDLQHQLAQIESELQFSRQFYNDTVVNMNIALTTIPSMWFRGIAGVHERPLFEETNPARRTSPDAGFTA